MKRSFVIDGKCFAVKIISSQWRRPPIETTAFADRWRRWIPSDLRILELEGITADGVRIEGIFRILCKTPDGTLVLESFLD